MKMHKDWHKYGSCALLAGFVISVFSGMTKHKKIHVASGLFIGMGMAACIYSGHKIIGAYKPEDQTGLGHD